MKSCGLIAGVVLLLSGCARETPSRERAEAPVEAPKAEVREVVLDAAAQRQAGLRMRKVAIRTLPQVIRANGRITVNEVSTWRVGASTDGRVIRVYANTGDEVLQGHVLARMHSHDIHEARALHRKAKADLAQARAHEAYARRVRDRARRLYELKAASLEHLDQSEAELQSAGTSLSNALVELERTTTHLEQFLGIPAESSGDEGAPESHRDEDLIPVKSPAAGTVLSRSVTPGSVVAPASELFVVSDLSTLWMIAAVSEEYLPRLRSGLPVRVFVQAYPERAFPGRIIHLGEELDPTTRTVKARVLLPNPRGQLKPEMYATAEIEVGGSEPALFIPQTAVQEVKGEAVVFVLNGAERFEMRTVTLGRTLDGFVEIVSGARAGDTVVVEGSFLLKSQLLKSVNEAE